MKISGLFLLSLAAAGVLCRGETPANRVYGPWRSSRIGGGGYVQTASFSKADPGRIYLASDVGGFFRTDDGGVTWRMLHGALPPGEGSSQIRGILAHPSRKDTFLVAAGSAWDSPRGIYRSDDAGNSFVLTLKCRFEGNDCTRSAGFVIASDPSCPERVYAAPVGDGVFRSDDFGKTWSSIGLEGVYPKDLVVDRSNPLRIWVNAADKGSRTYSDCGVKKNFRHGLFMTENGGEEWICVNDSEVPDEMVQDPVNPQVLHGTFRMVPQLRRSFDNGRTWSAYDNPEIFPRPGDARADGTYAALAAGPDFIIAAGHGGHFYRLEANGGAWSKLPAPVINEGDWFAAATNRIERHFGSALGFAAVSPHDADRWLFTDWYACYISPDSGKTWNLSVDGIEMTVLHCLAQDPSRPMRVHAGMADVGYFRSDDGAETFPLWGRHGKISNNIKHISVCQSEPDSVYAVGPATWKWCANQTFYSADGGAMWRRPLQRGLPNLDDGRNLRCNTICVSPSRPNEVYLVVSGVVRPGEGGVYRSADYGDSWEWMGNGLPETELFRSDIWVSGPELAVSSDGSAVAMSNDSGRGFVYDPAEKRWTEIDLPSAANCVAADLLVPGRFYCALKGAGLFRSDDGGRSWKNIFGGFAAYVASDAAKTGRIAVSSGSEYYVSEDAGETWVEIPEGLPFRHFRNVLCFAGDRLVCGTGGSGIFWTCISGLSGRRTARSNGAFFGMVSGGRKDEGGLLSNGSMAAGGEKPLGWSIFNAVPGKREMSSDSAKFVSPPASMCIKVDGGEAAVNRRLDGNQSGKLLKVECSVFLEEGIESAGIVLQCFDSDWKQIAWKQSAGTSEKGKWVRLSGTAEIPGGAGNVMFTLTAKGLGRVWADDAFASVLPRD